MRHLSLVSIVLVAAPTFFGCSSDDSGGSNTTDAGTGGAVAAGGASSSGGATPSSGGAVSSSGGKGGAPSSTGGMAASAGGATTDMDGGAADGGGKDIIETAVAAGGFTKLADALTKAGLVDALKGKGPFTVFAPTDAAFAAFETANPGVLAGLSKDALAGILKYHVVAGAAVMSKDLKDGQVVTTLNGSPALITTTGGVKVDDAKVTTADVEASNGVIHVIDKIILPPEKDIVETAVANGSFTKLAGALTSASLVDALKAPGPFTVFAPTDAAFAKLASVPTGDALKNVLLYHVAKGAVGSGDLVAGPIPTLLTGKSVTVSLIGGVKIDDAKVTTANVLTKNGVIHIIDTVLVPK